MGGAAAAGARFGAFGLHPGAPARQVEVLDVELEQFLCASAGSYRIRHRVFSRRWISRREMSRSIAVRERTGVSESSGVDCAADAGTSQPCSRHQDSHFATAARRAVQVLTAAWPQRDSRAAPISSSVTAHRLCCPDRVPLPLPM